MLEKFIPYDSMHVLGIRYGVDFVADVDLWRFLSGLWIHSGGRC